MVNVPSVRVKTAVHMRCSSSMAETITPSTPSPDASTILPAIVLVDGSMSYTFVQTTIDKAQANVTYRFVQGLLVAVCRSFIRYLRSCLARWR